MKSSNKLLLLAFFCINAFAVKKDGCAVFCRNFSNEKLGKYVTKDIPKELLKKKITGRACLFFNKKKLNFIRINQSGHQYIVENIHGTWQKLSLNQIKEEGVKFSIDRSFYKDGLEAGINYAVLKQVEQIFKDKVNFNRDLRKNDLIQLLVSDKSKVLMASISGGNKTFLAMRFNSHGKPEFYDINGHAMVDGFDRVPIKYRRISSPFRKSRKHPILGYSRPHKGVDLAADSGTPIHATSSGEVVSVGALRGYGRTVIIKHHDNYQTLYAHMHAYAKGLKVGDHVNRKQLIGYVGMTGLATAPHCHYEFRKGNVALDPMKVKLPLGEQLKGSRLKRFNALWNKRFKVMRNA